MKAPNAHQSVMMPPVRTHTITPTPLNHPEPVPAHPLLYYSPGAPASRHPHCAATRLLQWMKAPNAHQSVMMPPARTHTITPSPLNHPEPVPAHPLLYYSPGAPASPRHPFFSLKLRPPYRFYLAILIL